MDWPPVPGDPRFFRRSGPHSLAAVADAAEAEAAAAPADADRRGAVADGGADRGELPRQPQIRPALAGTRAGAVIVHPDMADRVPPTAVAIVSDRALCRLGKGGGAVPSDPAGAARRASVRGGGAGCRDRSERRDRAAGGDRRRAAIGPRCRIGPAAVIGEGVVLGATAGSARTSRSATRCWATG